MFSEKATRVSTGFCAESHGNLNVLDLFVCFYLYTDRPLLVFAEDRHCPRRRTTVHVRRPDGHRRHEPFFQELHESRSRTVRRHDPVPGKLCPDWVSDVVFVIVFGVDVLLFYFTFVVVCLKTDTFQLKYITMRLCARKQINKISPRSSHDTLLTDIQM